jgi:O-antigen ligase
MPSELKAETEEQASKPADKRPSRREPLGFAFFGLVLFMVVYFARPEDWVPGLAAVPLAKIAGILILLALFFSFSNIRWHMPREVIFLTLLVVQLWFTVLFSPVWRGGAFNVMLDFSKVLPLVLAVYLAVRSLKRLRWILFVQAASVAVIAVTSIIKAHVSGGRLEGGSSGTFGNSNDLALIMDLSLPLCLALALTTRSYWKKFAWTVVMLAMIYVVFLTASRGGAIALLVVALACLWQLGVKSRRIYLLLFIPVALVVFWLYTGSTLRGRFEQASLNPAHNTIVSSAQASVEQRKELLIRSLEVTAQHPLFGVGPGNFGVVSGVWHVTHNSYTQISAEGGIPALLLYLLILWSAIANLRDVRKYRKTGKGIRLFSMAIKASLAGYLVGSFFLSLAYNLFPYCLVAYTSALLLIVKRERTISSWAPQSQLTSTQVEVPVCED